MTTTFKEICHICKCTYSTPRKTHPSQKMTCGLCERAKSAAKRARKGLPPKKKKIRVNYWEYLASKHWAKRSAEFRKSKGNGCEVCGSEESTNTHHYNYLSLGNESDNDLFCLCRKCHEAYHSKFPARKLPTDAFNPRDCRLSHIQKTVLISLRESRTPTRNKTRNQSERASLHR